MAQTGNLFNLPRDCRKPILVDAGSMTLGRAATARRSRRDRSNAVCAASASAPRLAFARPGPHARGRQAAEMRPRITHITRLGHASRGVAFLDSILLGYLFASEWSLNREYEQRVAANGPATRGPTSTPAAPAAAASAQAPDKPADAAGRIHGRWTAAPTSATKTRCSLASTRVPPTVS
jgi:hypothetical protein